MDEEKNKGIEALLNEAESLLYKDIKKELEKLEKEVYPPIVNPEKYEKAKKIFEEVLSEDSENKKAKEGLKVCNDMLEPYVPVQYLMPLEDITVDVMVAPLEPLPESQWADKDNSETEEGATHEQVKSKLLPWEVRRKKLDELKNRDKAGLKYTAQVFSEECEKADKEVSEILKKANRLTVAGKDLAVVYEETKKELIALQERLNRSWKGQGPEIMHSALLELRKQLGIE